MTTPSRLPAEPPADLIDRMCMTWRHDFGLVRRDGDDSPIPNGMTEAEREALRRNMRQLWQHDVGPYVERAVAEALARAGVSAA